MIKYLGFTYAARPHYLPVTESDLELSETHTNRYITLLKELVVRLQLKYFVHFFSANS